VNAGEWSFVREDKREEQLAQSRNCCSERKYKKKKRIEKKENKKDKRVRKKKENKKSAGKGLGGNSSPVKKDALRLFLFLSQTKVKIFLNRIKVSNIPDCPLFVITS